MPLTELASPANCQLLATGQLANLPAAVTIDAGHPLIVGGSATQSAQVARHASLRPQRHRRGRELTEP